MVTKRAIMILAISLVLGLFATLAVSAEGSYPSAFLPGITDKDQTPNGCVSCHQGDYAISKELAGIKGHPNVSKMVKSVPDGCLTCHKADSKNAFNIVIHNAHYGKGKDSHFVSSYGGACLNCHSWTKDAGMGYKKGPWS